MAIGGDLDPGCRIVPGAADEGRGADLVLSLLALAVFGGFLLVYIRLRRVRRELTLVVRRLAVMEAEEGGAERVKP